MDGDLHVVLDFQGGKQQIVAVLGEVIGCPAHLGVHIDDAVGHVADVHGAVCPLLEVVSVEIHGLALVGEDYIDDEVPQVLAVLIAHVPAKIAHVQAVHVGSDVVYGAVLLLQGLLHEVEQ